MPNIDCDKIYYKEKKSTGERVGENAFYMPKYEEDPERYSGYSFGLEFLHVEFVENDEVSS